MKSEIYFLVCIYLLIANCNTTDFDRSNPNDPLSENFAPAFPENPFIAFNVDKNKVLELTYGTKIYTTGVEIYVKYDENSDYELVADVLSPSLTFYDSSGNFTHGSLYRTHFYRLNGNGDKLYNPDPVVTPLLFQPFQNLTISDDTLGGNFEITGNLLSVLGSPNHLFYFDGVEVVGIKSGTEEIISEINFTDFLIDFEIFSYRFSKSISVQNYSEYNSIIARQYMANKNGSRIILSTTE